MATQKEPPKDMAKIPGDEPYIVGEAIDRSWRSAWARCIALIWEIEAEAFPDKNVLTSKERDTIPNLWYRAIFSKDPKQVMGALRARGFIGNGFPTPEMPKDPERWVNAVITVKYEDEAVKIGEQIIVKGSIQSKDWQVPEYKPSEYIYELPEGKSEENPEEKLVEEPGYVNGWAIKKGKKRYTPIPGLKHTLVLTVPRRPIEKEHFALALVDFQAAEHLYPFTPCC